MVGAWRKRDLESFAKRLSSQNGAVLRIELTGIRQTMQLDGRRYASKILRNRTDHELYQKCSLPFDGIPPEEEDACHLIQSDFEMFGYLEHRRVAMEGYVGVAAEIETLKANGTVGSISIVSMDAMDDEPAEAVLKFSLELGTLVQVDQFIYSIQLGLLARPTVWLALKCLPLADADAWMLDFGEHGWSNQIAVTSVALMTAFGSAKF